MNNGPWGPPEEFYSARNLLKYWPRHRTPFEPLSLCLASYGRSGQVKTASGGFSISEKGTSSEWPALNFMTTSNSSNWPLACKECLNNWNRHTVRA